MFEARRFLEENFGDIGGLIARCRAANVEPPNEAAVQKWRQRNSIPGEWLTKLVSVLEAERGEAVSLRPYMGASS